MKMCFQIGQKKYRELMDGSPVLVKREGKELTVVRGDWVTELIRLENLG